MARKLPPNVAEGVIVLLAVGLAFGYVSTRYSIFTGFGLLGSILLVYAAYYSLFQHRLRENVLG